VVKHSRLGLTTFVGAESGGAIAVARDPAAPRNERMLFFEQHGAAFGITAPAAELREDASAIDELGRRHTTYQQLHEGIPVFSGILKVHQDVDGEVLSAAGRYYPLPAKLELTPALTEADAEWLAMLDLSVPDVATERIELTIVDPGWYGDPARGAQLAYHVVLSDAALHVREAYFVDAQSGEILDRWSLICELINRQVYDGNEGTALPGTLERSEGQAPAGDGDVDRMYDYAGDTYDLLWRGFGRDSINGAGMPLTATAHSMFGGCSNARWNGVQTIFCTGMATDDVTGHEFAHGLTQFTAGLIYQNQSGQLNESYSDVFGELVDLYNGDCAFAGPPAGPSWPEHSSGPGGDTPNNLRGVCSPSPENADGKRWLVGEDIAGASLTGAIRDMWDPTCRSHPDRANSPLQTCNSMDSGGVHSGSGVPNHAFAMLTDGKTFNGRTVTGIGPIKAGAVWYRALTVYLTPASDFEDAYLALNQAAADLVGTTPLDPRTGLPSASVFSAADAAEVDDALRAVELNSSGACGQGDDVLAPGPVSVCTGRTTLFSDAFESGVNGWTVGNSAPPTPYNWAQAGDLPLGRAGIAWFCDDPSIGTCSGSGDESGSHHLTSPVFALPAGADFPYVQFTHYLASEGNWDGGNVKVRVNGGAWQVIPRSAFTANPYNARINTVGQGNTNPLAGEAGFSGAGGRWGTSVIDLSAFAGANDTLQVRFEFGKDGCTGVTGWYVDDFELFACPDCDSNAEADVRAYRYNTASEALGNIGVGAPQSFAFPTPPAASGDVRLTLHAMGDFSSAAEYVNLDLNGVDLGDVFIADGNDCGATPDRQTITVAAATWNAGLGGGTATLNFITTPDVNPTTASNNCSGSSYISVFIDYPRSVADCDGDGVPDACEGGAPSISVPPQPVSACIGDPAMFTVTAAGAAPLAYQWRHAGDDISGATGTSYTIPAVATADAGNYDVVVSNGCSSVTSAAAALTVTGCADSPGDMNCDGGIDFFDIDPFLMALFNPAAYESAFPQCNLFNADMNHSGTVDFFDIDPFLECLFNDICG
jgi:Zn-dependent metalloprotease